MIKIVKRIINYIKHLTKRQERCVSCGQYIDKNVLIKAYMGGERQTLCSCCFIYLMEKDYNMSDD